MLTLGQALKISHLTKLQAMYPTFRVADILLDRAKTDGPGNALGTAFGGKNWMQFVLGIGKYRISIDPADFPVNKPLDLDNNYKLRLVICHELHHIADYHEGFFKRLKIWWDRKKPYEERHHEIEAHEVGERNANNW